MSYSVMSLSSDLRRRIDDFFARFGHGMNAYIETHSRHDEIAALEAKSDADLARMGLTRDGIVAHVFRDMIWI